MKSADHTTRGEASRRARARREARARRLAAPPPPSGMATCSRRGTPYELTRYARRYCTEQCRKLDEQARRRARLRLAEADDGERDPR